VQTCLAVVVFDVEVEDSSALSEVVLDYKVERVLLALAYCGMQWRLAIIVFNIRVQSMYFQQ